MTHRPTRSEEAHLDLPAAYSPPATFRPFHGCRPFLGYSGNAGLILGWIPYGSSHRRTLDHPTPKIAAVPVKSE